MMLASLSLLTLAAAVQAHTIFQRVYVNGVDQGYLNGVRYPTYDGPITVITDPSVICNGGPNPLVTPYSQTVINIPAGATVGAQWDHVLQPNGWTSTDTADPIDPGHLGPVLAYMAKVPDATQTDVTGLGWFKIWEDGFDGTTWGVTRLYNAHGNQTFTIPSCLEPGNYFLRAEIIALHAASSYPGAQLYMECAQVNIVGSGTATPPTVSFPGAYSPTDPGILIDIYYPPVTNYTIPGPTVFTCPGGSPTSTAKTTSSTSKATSTTTTTAVTTSKATTTTSTVKTTTSTSSSAASTATGTAVLYGQCGGIGYSGPTACVSGSVCTYSSAYYSQCLPS